MLKPLASYKLHLAWNRAVSANLQHFLEAYARISE